MPKSFSRRSDQSFCGGPNPSSTCLFVDTVNVMLEVFVLSYICLATWGVATTFRRLARGGNQCTHCYMLDSCQKIMRQQICGDYEDFLFRGEMEHENLNTVFINGAEFFNPSFKEMVKQPPPLFDGATTRTSCPDALRLNEISSGIGSSSFGWQARTAGWLRGRVSASPNGTPRLSVSTAAPTYLQSSRVH